MRKILSLAFILLFVSTGYAATGGSIAGIINGPDGSAFKAAFVRAQNVQTKMITIVLSNPQGKYLVNNLAPGTYEVWANSFEYKSDPAKRSGIKVDDGQTVNLNFKMQKGTAKRRRLTRSGAGF